MKRVGLPQVVPSTLNSACGRQHVIQDKGGQRGSRDLTDANPEKATTFRRGGTAGVATALLILIVLAFSSCALGTQPGLSSGTHFIFFTKTCVCLRVLVDMREGQLLNPLPSKVRLSRICSGTGRGSWEMGAWGALGCMFGSQTGGAGEWGTSSCITTGERGRKAALFFFLPWAACVGCAGGAATEAEGFLDQLTRLGKGGGASWGFDSLGILNCETLEAASAQAPEIGLRLL